MAGRMGGPALPAVPATLASSAGIAVKMIFHETAAAWGMACLVGLLTLLAVFVVSAEAQKTVRLWIRHRAEHRLAAAKSFEIRRQIQAATCGRRWTKSSADKVRKAAEAYDQISTSLPEIMRITRGQTLAPTVRELGNGNHNGSQVAGGDGATRGRLEVVLQPDTAEGQANPG
jgi:hypothetical protein